MKRQLAWSQRVVRAIVAGLVVTAASVGCAARGTPDRDVVPPQVFVPDVTESEWDAAIPSKGSSIAQPRLLRGKTAPDVRGVVRVGETATATVAIVIRADGSVGVFKVLVSTNPRLTERAIEVLRSQKYESPLLNGGAVSIRDDMSFTVTVSREVMRVN